MPRRSGRRLAGSAEDDRKESPLVANVRSLGGIDDQSGSAGLRKKGDTKSAETLWGSANLYYVTWSATGCQNAFVTGPSTTGIAAPVAGVSATR